MVHVRRFALLAVLVFALSVTGCVGLLGDDGGTDVDPDEYDAEELRANASAAMSDAETYSFESEQSFDVEEWLPDGNSTSLTLTVEADGASDESTGATRMDSQTVLETDMGGIPTSGSVYMEGDRVYLEESGNWSEKTMDGPWPGAGQEVALLEGSDAEIVGAETVQGHETVVLEVNASDDAVADYGFDGNATADPRPSGSVVESSTVRLYVGADAPHYVYRTVVETTMTADDPETVVEATFTRTYGDFGDDVDVERPAAIDG